MSQTWIHWMLLSPKNFSLSFSSCTIYVTAPSYLRTLSLFPYFRLTPLSPSDLSLSETDLRLQTRPELVRFHTCPLKVPILCHFHWFCFFYALYRPVFINRANFPRVPSTLLVTHSSSTWLRSHTVRSPRLWRNTKNSHGTRTGRSWMNSDTSSRTLRMSGASFARAFYLVKQRVIRTFV